MGSEDKKKSGASRRVLSVIGGAVCVLLGFMLICNLTIIVKGTLFPEKPPSVLGITPFVVKSGSMSGTGEGHIEVGDLIFVGSCTPKELKEGDVIAFMEGKIVVTHRIIGIQSDDGGSLLFRTQGDANNSPDTELVKEENIVGIYKSRIPKVGDFALFLQTPLGMLIFIGIPVIGFIIYDIIRRQYYSDKERKQASEMQEELERLRAIADGKTKAEEAAAQSDK